MNRIPVVGKSVLYDRFDPVKRTTTLHKFSKGFYPVKRSTT